MMNQCSPEQLSVYKESSMKKLFVVPIILGFAAIAFAGQADARPAVALRVRLSGELLVTLSGMAA
jgi:hypothetical protein